MKGVSGIGRSYLIPVHLFKLELTVDMFMPGKEIIVRLAGLKLSLVKVYRKKVIPSVSVLSVLTIKNPKDVYLRC